MDDILYEQYLGYFGFGNVSKAQYYDSTTQVPENKWISDDELIRLLPQFVSRGSANNDAHAAAAIKILAVPGTGILEDMEITKALFTQVIDQCGFPRTLVQAAFANNGQFAYYIEYENQQAQSVPEFLSVVLKYPHSPLRSISCVLRTRLSDRYTTCFLFDEDEDRIPTLIVRLKSRLAHLHRSPFHLICILAEVFGYRAERWRENLDHSIVDMEKCIGKTGFFDVEPLADPIEDHEQMLKDLQIVNTSLIWLDGVTHFELELGRFGRQMIELCESLRESRGLRTLSTPERAAMEQEGRFHWNGCEFRRYQAHGLHQRVQTQISILYSQISQRDSRINLSVAQDSRRIASAAQRDSRAMKTIAVLTLFFLPATLIASIYSTGIFDVQADLIAVSRLWWSYAVSSISLTVFVFAVWGLYMQCWPRAKRARRFRKADVETAEVEKIN